MTNNEQNMDATTIAIRAEIQRAYEDLFLYGLGVAGDECNELEVAMSGYASRAMAIQAQIERLSASLYEIVCLARRTASGDPSQRIVEQRLGIPGVADDELDEIPFDPNGESLLF